MGWKALGQPNNKIPNWKIYLYFMDKSPLFILVVIVNKSQTIVVRFGNYYFNWNFNSLSIKRDVITSFLTAELDSSKRVKKFWEKIEPRAFKKLINNWSARSTQAAKVNFSSMRQFEELFSESFKGQREFFSLKELFSTQKLFSFLKQ